MLNLVFFLPKFRMRLNNRVLTIFKRAFASVPQYNPNIRPFAGIAELNSSPTTFKHVATTTEATLFSQEELNKLAGLSYLQSPSTPEEAEKTINSLNKFVSWLSNITHVDVNAIPRPADARPPVQRSSPTEDTLITPSRLPVFSPLPILARTVSPASIATGAPASVDGELSLLRLRPDVVAEGGISAAVTANAKNKDRGYFVVPASMDGDE